jgi:ubiquinone/menaquinone biosynthesis C-methylase UbiE
MSAGDPAAADPQARVAKLYDAEILPAYAARFAQLLLGRVTPHAAARVIEVGCATGAMTRELARRFRADSHVTAMDESAAFLAEARAKIQADRTPHARVAFIAQAGVPLRLPIEAGAADHVVSNLAIATCSDPPAAVREAARLLAPGGQMTITAPLRGSWGEFLDLFRDVLVDAGKAGRVAAVDRYVRALPDGDAVAGWLRNAGLADVEVTLDRWEILFRSAREFFYAPLVAQGPLPAWKKLAGGGDDMQDVFFFTKEAIDTYFRGRPFAVTVMAAAVKGTRR